MHLARFVFLTLRQGVMWTLVSPNNRPLGRGGRLYDTYAECRESVVYLREGYLDARSSASTVDATGQWVWRIELGDETVAMSSRSYLRVRECTYNLDRFLEAVPRAQIVAGARTVRSGRSVATEDVRI